MKDRATRIAPWTRRQFLERTGAAIAGGVALRYAGFLGGDRAIASSRFTNPVFFPQVLDADEIELAARVTQHQIFDSGPATELWTFGPYDESFPGSFPGPTIRRRAGDLTKVTIHHRLPAEVGTLSVHHHGGHTASAFDGQPGRYVIQPGASYTYEYELMEDGAPERGAFQWYHDHTHFLTSRNVWMGLAGFFVIEDDEDLGLPTGNRDFPLMIADRFFDGNNQLISIEGRTAPFDDLEYNVVLVNGTANPVLEVDPAPYRLRFLGASNFRPFNLVLNGAGPWLQIGTDAGLTPAPVVRDAILLGPAERAEVIVDFSDHAGETLTLASRADARQRSTAPAITDIMEIRVASGPAGPTVAVPATLRALPEWVGEASADPDRVWTFGIGTDEAGNSAWTINGRAFDHQRIDARVEIGSVETWMLINTTPIATSHFIHIHLADWYVLSRNGEAPEPGEAALKETFRLDPGESLVIAAKFTDHLGPYMIHCHMLEHEDHGMMTVYEVVPKGEGDLATNAVPGVSSFPREALSDLPVVGTLIAGLPTVVPLANMTPEEAQRAARILEEQVWRPGLPAEIEPREGLGLPTASPHRHRHV